MCVLLCVVVFVTCGIVFGDELLCVGCGVLCVGVACCCVVLLYDGVGVCGCVFRCVALR